MTTFFLHSDSIGAVPDANMIALMLISAVASASAQTTVSAWGQCGGKSGGSGTDTAWGRCVAGKSIPVLATITTINDSQ
jgi:hypothetical protein